MVHDRLGVESTMLLHKILQLGWGLTPTNLMATKGWLMITGVLEASTDREDSVGPSS